MMDADYRFWQALMYGQWFLHVVWLIALWHLFFIFNRRHQTRIARAGLWGAPLLAGMVGFQYTWSIVVQWLMTSGVLPFRWSLLTSDVWRGIHLFEAFLLAGLAVCLLWVAIDARKRKPRVAAPAIES